MKTPPFKKGQHIWLEAKNLNLPYNKKISSKREGPFEIQEVMGPVTYKLKLPTRWQNHNVFHAALLTPYLETETHGPNHTNPPPDLVEGNPEWEVESILSHQRQGHGYQYLMHWKGYGSADNSWEPAGNLKNAQETINLYKQCHGLL